MYTHTHIYTVCFTDIPLSYICIYIYIYTLFHHTELSICFTPQIAHYHTHIYIYTYILRFTTQSQHMFFHTDGPVLPHRWSTIIYIYIYSFSPHRVDICFFHTDGPVLPHSGNQQSGWWLIHHHLTLPYVHTHTHKCTVCVTDSPSSYIHICIYIYIYTYILCFTT